MSVVEVSRKEAELEKASEAQLSHMDCDKVAQAALKFGEDALRVLSLLPSLNIERDPGQKAPAER